MALDPDDYGEIIRHFLAALQDKDSVMFEQVMKFREDWHTGNPHQDLLNLISVSAEFGQIRTTGVHAHILDRLNKHVRTEDGRAIAGVHVALTPLEQELYRRKFLDLTPRLDFSKYLGALRELYREINKEEGGFNDERGFEK